MNTNAEETFLETRNEESDRARIQRTQNVLGVWTTTIRIDALIRLHRTSYTAASQECPLDLVGYLDLHSEILSELPHHARVLLERAADEDHVGLALVEDALREHAIVDSTNGADQDLVADCSLDLRGELCLESLGVGQW